MGHFSIEACVVIYHNSVYNLWSLIISQVILETMVTDRNERREISYFLFLTLGRILTRLDVDVADNRLQQPFVRFSMNGD